MTGNRHFATLETGGEEVIVLGHRVKTNEVLVCFPSALPQTEAQELRRIVLSETAQRKDYLMDQVGGSVLGMAHHSSGKTWEAHVLTMAMARRGNAVRKMTMKELIFSDPTQKAFFAGYGPSIEPEVDAIRKNRIAAQDAMLNGRQIPLPIQAIPNATVDLPPAAAPAAQAASDATNSALIAALASIAQTNAAILTKLEKLEKGAKAEKPPGKKPGPKPKVAAAPAPAPAAVTTDEVAATE